METLRREHYGDTKKGAIWTELELRKFLWIRMDLRRHNDCWGSRELRETEDVTRQTFVFQLTKMPLEAL